MMERLLDAERNLTVGLVDQAEAIYRSLTEADPRNAVAMVGLARCALERGDETGAYELTVRALTIDPDDAMALRMEARLSEVLAARGRPVTRPAFVLPPAERSESSTDRMPAEAGVVEAGAHRPPAESGEAGRGRMPAGAGDGWRGGGRPRLLDRLLRRGGGRAT